MDDVNVTPLPATPRDEYRASVERQVRNLEAISEVSDRLATIQHRFYESYRKAGFDDWDARYMASELIPSFR